MLYQRFTIGNQSFCLISGSLQFIGNLKFQLKNCSLKCDHICSGTSFIHAEELKISTEIKNIEFLLILSIHQGRAQTGTSPDHLPEFRLTHNLFEKYQIQNFRHINSRIQHIYRDCYLRKLL